MVNPLDKGVRKIGDFLSELHGVGITYGHKETEIFYVAIYNMSRRNGGTAQIPTR